MNEEIKVNQYAAIWCQEIIDTLCKMDANHFFVAPGSRNTPLIDALVHNTSAKIFYSYDERSLGFMALGFAKKSKKCAVVITTSGTAVANLYPAVCEAELSEVPLLLLTADRPQELRDCGANQTINQSNIFLNHAKKSFDLGAPDSQSGLLKSKQIISQALFAAKNSPPAPVHVNVAFKEPFYFHNGPQNILTNLCDQTLGTISCAKNYYEVDEKLFAGRGLFVVGELLSGPCQELILALAEKLNWPIYADICSNLRQIDHQNILPRFEILLSNQKFCEALGFDRIIFLGGRLVSKRFWQELTKISCKRFIRISDSSKNYDQVGVFDQVIVSDILGFLKSALEKSFSQNQTLPALKKFEENVQPLVESFLDKKNNNEAYFACRLVEKVEEPCNFFIANSMPIRDLDMFLPNCASPCEFLVNRGASGIDGNIATFVGMSLAKKIPSIMLVGDLAFLHDTNALFSLKFLKEPYLIVVINNDGGGIFQFLPVFKDQKIFSPILEMTHQVNLKNICQAFSIDNVQVENAAQYDQALEKFFVHKQSFVLEVKIKKRDNYNLHQDVYEQIKNIS